LIAFAVEVDQERSRFELQRQCEPYARKQVLFVREPDLYRRVRTDGSGDLLDVDGLKHTPGCSAFKTESGYARISYLLPSKIVEWAKMNYPNAKLFVCLDPHRFYEEPPRRMLNEVAIRPVDPRWLSQLMLRNGMRDGGEYLLEPGDPREDLKAYWEYHIRGIRKLEFCAHREGEYLSMMIEELREKGGDAAP
jgi:hypothetical protein